jgi:hypothetical protein
MMLVLSGAADAGNDFNGDGKSDVVWRQPNGQIAIWSMDGLGVPSYRITGPVMDNTWIFAGAGYFGGGAPNSVLWLSAGHAPMVWYMQNGGYSTSCSVGNMGDLTGGRLLGFGDIDGDGYTDVLWLDADGNVRVRIIAVCAAVRTLPLTVPPASAAAAAVADFDGDGKADLLWREPSGQYTVWLLDGKGVRSSTVLSPSIPVDWHVAKTADFNADGKSDLLWRKPDGSLAISYMDGAAHTESSVAPADPDKIFADGFGDSDAITPPSSLPLDWQVVDVGDYDGDGDPDILFANAQGYTQTWQMAGPLIQAAVMRRPVLDMPYAGFTGWVLPMDRPSVTQIDAQVSIAWPLIPGVQDYTVHASAQQNAASTGVTIPATGGVLTYPRTAPDYADKRYFSMTTSIFGLSTPPSPDAYLLEFNQIDLAYVASMAIADINGDGCIDIMGALGNCHGGFTPISEADMGLAALRAGGRLWRDLRFADFDGDGIDDVIASVYAAQSDTTSRILFFHGTGGGHFVEDTAFTALGLGGYDETLVVADFDNDGDLDIFLPKYTFYDPNEHNYLLMNDGHGHFTDMSDSAGVAMRETPLTTRSEAAQAADFDDDGRLDIYTGSHLFMNRTTTAGSPLFVDQAANRGLPVTFDEGAKFLDWNNDGALDLVILDVSNGPRVWQSNGNSFHFVDVTSTDVSWNAASGMNVGDLDGDGRPDIVADRGCKAAFSEECTFVQAPHEPPALLLNRGTSFVHADYFDDGIADNWQRPFADLQTLADFDGNGTLDPVVRYPHGNPPSVGTTRVLMNRAAAPSIRVTVLGASGERNQQGRVVRVSPVAKPGFVMTDVVDGGSGYLANTAYTLQFAAQWPGSYLVDVRVADLLIEVPVRAGANLTVYADGRVLGASGSATVKTRKKFAEAGTAERQVGPVSSMLARAPDVPNRAVRRDRTDRPAR